VTLLSSSLEGGSNGAALTAGSSGNTASSGSFFDTVNIVSGGAVAFSTTQAMHGTLSVVTSTGTTTTSGAWFGWDTQLAGGWSQLYGRAYVFPSALPGTTDAIVETQSPAGTFGMGIQLSASTGLLAIQNAAFSTVHTFTNAVPTGAWSRLEWLVNYFTGQITLAFYPGDSATATESYTSGTGQGFGASAQRIGFGYNNGHASQPNLFWDDVGVSSQGFLGVGPGVAAQSSRPVQLIVPPGRCSPVGQRFVAQPPPAPLVSSSSNIALSDAGAAADAPPSQQPYVIASANEASGSATYNVPVTTASSAGDGITVFIGVGGTSPPAITSVTDSQGQKYRQIQQSSTSPYLAAFAAPGSIALGTSDTLTVTFAASTTGGFGVVAVGTPGMRAVDVATSITTGNSASPAVSGTPSAGGEIALAAFAWGNAAGTGTLAAPFTQLAQAHPTGGAYTTVATTASSPTAGQLLSAGASITSGAWRAILVTLEPVPPWYLSNSSYIHQMYVQDPSSASQFFNSPADFALSNSTSSTGIQDSFTSTPVLKYISYAQLQADITASAISGSYSWLMYDNEYQDDGAGGNAWGTPMTEANDPWTYMQSFVTLAHAHGYKVILAPGRDLGNNASLVNPKGTGESLDAWYIRTNIAGTGAGTGAEVMHVQAQADTVPLTSFQSFWNSTLAQIAAASATCLPSVGVSTTYGAASDMAAAAQAVAPTAAGYWLNATNATIPQASSFLELMQGVTPTTPQTQEMAGSADTLSAAAAVPLGDPAGAAESATVSAATASADAAGATDGLTVSVPVSVADTAGSSDALSVSVPIPVADAAGAADALAVTVSAALADTAGASDRDTSPGPAGAVPDSDQGAAADSIAVAYGIGLAEVGAVSDALRPAASVPLSEAAGAADSIAVTVTASLSDTAGVSDALVPAAAVPVADTAGASDTPQETATAASSDVAGASDALTVVQGSAPALPEAGAAADSATVQASAPLAESGASLDSLAVAVTVPLAESAAAAEATPREPFEVAGASDQLTASVTVPVSDTAAGSDALTPQISLTLPDAAGAADAFVVVVGNAITLADTGAATDAPVQSVTGPEAEQAAATDQLIASASVPAQDAAGAADSLAVVVGNQVALPELAAGADSLAAAAGVPEGDVAAGADALTQTASVPVSDLAGAADALSVVAGAVISLTDAGAATDRTAETGTEASGETAGSSDTLAAVASVPVPDVAAAAEVLITAVSVPAQDMAGAADAISVVQSAAVALQDAAGAAEALRVQVTVQLAEQAAAAELVQPTVTLSFTDVAGTRDSVLVLSSTAQSGTVHYWAQPEQPRWLAENAPERFWTGPDSARWRARPMARWGAQSASPRWSAVLENFQPIAAVSLEQVNVRWTSDLDGTSVDPTVAPLPVQMAFPVSSGVIGSPAQPVTWFTASWLAGGTGKGYVAQCLVGPGGGTTTLTAGKYDVWSKITGSPESPARFVGTLTVY
jgi:trimeric autotransporter adhesin